MKTYEIRKPNINEAKEVVKFIDSTFTVEGYGFVTSAQIKTENTFQTMPFLLSELILKRSTYQL